MQRRPESRKETSAQSAEQGGNLRRVAMPDIFGGAETKKRPATVTILCSVEEAFRRFRDFSRFSSFMKNVSRVEKGSAKKFRFYGPNDREGVEVELLSEEPNESITWRVLGRFPQLAAATFEPSPNGRGTIVSYKIAYETSLGGVIGAAKKAVAATEKFIGDTQDPDTEAAVDLRRFKALLETGEIPTVEGQPSGRDEQAAA